MGTKSINTTLKRYVEKINTLLKPEQVILYGSFVRGEARSWSDIDLLIVADFKKKKEYELMNMCALIGSRVDDRFLFDVRLINKKEFKRVNKLSIYSEIKKEGKIIYQNQLK
jgi:predicted nucleotidyltransferase